MATREMETGYLILDGAQMFGGKKQTMGQWSRWIPLLGFSSWHFTILTILVSQPGCRFSSACSMKLQRSEPWRRTFLNIKEVSHEWLLQLSKIAVGIMCLIDFHSEFTCLSVFPLRIGGLVSFFGAFQACWWVSDRPASSSLTRSIC